MAQSRFPFRLPDTKPYDAVGFGLNAVDRLIIVPEYPRFDTKIRLIEQKPSAGGQTASAIVALQRLGWKTAYAGRFGTDEEGRFSLSSMKAEGVNLEFAEVIEGAKNQMSFIIIDARNGERTIIWDRDERLAYQSGEAPVDLAGRGRILHMDAHDPPACVRMARAARAADTIVSADIDNVYEGLPDLLPWIDILITSKEFPDRLLGIRDQRRALVELHSRYGCPLTGITLGTRGVMVYCDGRFTESPAFEVPGGCRDTTGAGDAFHAGFLHGLLRGENIEDCLRLANAVAALKCRALGARTALPTAAELEEFLSSK